MLVTFSIGNFLSFRNKQTLSLEPDGLKEFPENVLIPYLYSPNERLLKSVAIYGHNSYGKTNLLKGFSFLQKLVFSSFSVGQTTHQIPIEPFRLNTAMQGQPTTFEIIFLVKQTKYRYRIALTETQIIEEELHYAENKIRENFLFVRIGQEFRVSKNWNKESNNRVEQATFFTKPHILFLSVLLSQENIPKVTDVAKWFSSNLVIPDTYLEEFSKAHAVYSDGNYRALILKFIENADVGFNTIFDKVESLSKTHSLEKGLLNMWFEKEIKNFELFTKHVLYDAEHKEVGSIEFDLQKNESAGSIKYFIIVCLLAYAIRNSQTVWIDELDARFDSTLLEMLVKTFHHPDVNPVKSQMIFTTHNTILLDECLRRDQMIVVEKNKWGESTLKRIHTAETPIRIGKPIEKEYRKGKLGGVSKKLRDNLGPSLFDGLNIQDNE